MAPNKFEKYIKKQFEEREIRPSSEAWLKLSDRLDETIIATPKKRGYFRYALAACIIGLLIVSVVFFSTTTTSSEPNIQVVEDETEVIDEVDDFQKIEIQKNAVEVVATEEIPKKKKNIVVKTTEEIFQKEAVMEQLSDTSEKIQSPLNDTPEEVLNIKIREVIAQVDELEQNQEQLTEAEVDSLLRKAQEEILTSKLFRGDHSVDAMALLSEAEEELDKSFRDQIFESLKSGFIKVRTAVADRNN